MKFVAVLKDSFREALDSKVLYVMVGLSLVVILLVGCIGYRPLAGDEALADMVTEFYRFDPFHHQRPDDGWVLNHATVRDVRRLDDAALPYAGEYQFTFESTWNHWGPKLEVKDDAHDEAKNPAEVEADRAAKEPGNLTAFAEEFAKTKFELHDLKILSIKPLPDQSTAKRAVFDIQARGKGVPKSWPHRLSFFFGAFEPSGASPLGRVLYGIENTLVNGWGAWLAILVSIIITAFFIPNMLHKGTIDLLLAKPIGRGRLLLYKYVGGLTFMFVNSAVAVTGIWFVLGLRSGVWAPGLLLSIFVLTFFFAVLYSISTLIAVLTRSAVVAILISCLSWFVFFAIGNLYFFVELTEKAPAMGQMPKLPGWAVTTARAIHAVTPRTSDLDYLTNRVLTESLLGEAETSRNPVLAVLPEFSWGESVTVNLLFIAAMLGLAIWRFARRDY
jgi:ABC-type transport system involved in multi-copper enzyme maturation permease subunit